MIDTLLSDVGNFLAGARAMMMYWILAIAGTVFFGIVCILSLFGLGGIDHPDFDADGSVLDHADTGYLDFKLFSLRSILAFLTVFGWGGVIWGSRGISGFLLALFCGFLTMLITASILYFTMRLQYSGNVGTKDFIGRSGTVYLSIPGGMAETGKVVVSCGGATHELPAVAEEPLPTGTPIVVVKSVDGRHFLVKKTQ